MSHFEVNLRWPVGEDEHEAELIVSGTYASSPGNRRGHPDDWTPPWSELEVNAITCAETGAPYPAQVVGALCGHDAFLEAVEAKILDERRHIS